MQRDLPSDRLADDRRYPLLLWALAFWGVTYLLFTVRARLAPEMTGLSLGAPRLVSITAGALLFGLVIHAAQRWLAMGRPGVRLLWTVIPASLAVLGVRSVANDWAGAGMPFTGEVRWMLTWASYFACALGLFLLVQREGSAGRLIRHAAASVSTHRASAAPAPKEPVDAGAAEWLVDTLAEEMAGNPPAARAALLARLAQRAGYEVADGFDVDAHNARVRLVARLSARL